MNLSRQICVVLKAQHELICAIGARTVFTPKSVQIVIMISFHFHLLS